ncbi:MAG: Flavohemoprotein (Hemoglobin-like protein) (Flavohemoglobin) (Nitric oxide dioxygenase) (EC [uncultured Sulfurovum sp.]|uniref:Flavohemoprotein (Hemoglobin-like protein) (Flavohemoglobin) (Nitric oxide dioxygenase) (EC) n=1 Tax=uncultured Sulfurovum sp. TaxID=269237 RepID=A0A6S6UIP0_9BACT|nr:MAG: Flavohemoprotein (Hemoglobin-like protein) (Flavohemoglobin) (Nitric oxide dioxygenase) (EC [uncultured Sulfurovum sp.]
MNETTKAIIKSTAPVLKEHGESITTEMYKVLFSKYPQTQELFKDATADQHKKLANAVYAYAANIDKLENLSKGIEKMATVHVKTNVRPEHYPMVGDALLQAIKIVLGEGATEEVMSAWEEAYGFLAEVLIAREKEMYSSI